MLFQWGLDMTGNWSDFTQKTSGSTGLDQDRTHNGDNEITDISKLMTPTSLAIPFESGAGKS